MGMFDEIRWDAALPAGHPEEERLFQTKSLDPCWDRYVVNAEGRLLLVGSGWGDDDSFEDRRRPPVDVGFHGDLRLISVGGGREYLVRFTHGTVEWVRPLAPDEPWDAVAVARLAWNAGGEGRDKPGD